MEQSPIKLRCVLCHIFLNIDQDEDYYKQHGNFCLDCIRKCNELSNLYYYPKSTEDFDKLETQERNKKMHERESAEFQKELKKLRKKHKPPLILKAK